MEHDVAIGHCSCGAYHDKPVPITFKENWKASIKRSTDDLLNAVHELDIAYRVLSANDAKIHIGYAESVLEKVKISFQQFRSLY